MKHVSHSFAIELGKPSLPNDDCPPASALDLLWGSLRSFLVQACLGHQMAATPSPKKHIVSYFSGILDVWTDGLKIEKGTI